MSTRPNTTSSTSLWPLISANPISPKNTDTIDVQPAAPDRHPGAGFPSLGRCLDARTTGAGSRRPRTAWTAAAPSTFPITVIGDSASSRTSFRRPIPPSVKSYSVAPSSCSTRITKVSSISLSSAACTSSAGAPVRRTSSAWVSAVCSNCSTSVCSSTGLPGRGGGVSPAQVHVNSGSFSGMSGASRGSPRHSCTARASEYPRWFFSRFTPVIVNLKLAGSAPCNWRATNPRATSGSSTTCTADAAIPDRLASSARLSSAPSSCASTANSSAEFPTPTPSVAPGPHPPAGRGPGAALLECQMQQPSRERRAQYRLDSDVLRAYRGESGGVEAVGGYVVRRGVGDGAPGGAVQPENLPGGWDSALAEAGVVEPVRRHLAQLAGLAQVVLDPLRCAAPVPPGEARDGGVCGGGRQSAVVGGLE